MLTFTLISAAIFGLIIGSFLNVCIYRLPRSESFYAEENGETESIPAPIGFNDPPRSICPKCNNQLKWWHNIPVLSWMFLGGKCGFCKAKISVRYPSVEIITGLLSVLSFGMYGLNLTGAVIFLFSTALLVITFIDYDYYIIPNKITFPGFFIGVGIVGINQFFKLFDPPIAGTLLESLYGVLAGAGFLYFIAEVYLKLRKLEGLGMGDVKLLAMVGALFGPVGALYTIFVGSLIGSVIGISLIIITRRKFTQHLPFGPFLAVGTYLYLFVGEALPQIILNMFFPIS